MFSEFDRAAMTQALALAERGLETTHPNPRVGCVIAKDDRIVAEGWHERAGEAHAEVAALRATKEPVVGGTAYVTLEPCSHHGRTPPCANALIEARVARVVFAVQDPNPRVSGQGAEALLRAGILVEAGLMEAEATELNIGFMKRMKHGLPWVRVKLAMSLDGRTALANGASQWITGEAARFDVQRWRARCSAVMTGVGTVIADDPQLNVRAAGFKGKQPLRVVLDAGLRSPVTAKVFAGLIGGVGTGLVDASPAPGVSGSSTAASAGATLVFTALSDNIPVAAPVLATASASPLDLADDMADLVKAFETLPSSVTAPVTAEPPPLASASAPRMSTASVAGPSATRSVSAPASAASTPKTDPGATDSVRPQLQVEASAADDATWAGAALSNAVAVGSLTASSSNATFQPPAAPNVLGDASSSTTSGAAAVTPGSTPKSGLAGTPSSAPTSGTAASSSPAPTSVPGVAGTPSSAPTLGSAATPNPPRASASRLAAAPPAASKQASASLEARRAALVARGVRLEEVPAEDGLLDLQAVLQKLAQLEVNEVLVEAGPTLAGQLLTTFFADELLIYIAPKLLGPQGRPLVNLPELQSLQDAWGFSVFDAKRFGDDLRLRLRPK